MTGKSTAAIPATVIKIKTYFERKATLLLLPSLHTAPGINCDLLLVRRLFCSRCTSAVHRMLLRKIVAPVNYETESRKMYVDRCYTVLVGTFRGK